MINSHRYIFFIDCYPSQSLYNKSLVKLKYNARTVFLSVCGSIKFERQKIPYSIAVVLHEKNGKVGRSRFCERADRTIIAFIDQT